MNSSADRLTSKALVAFAITYLVCGTTILAILIGVRAFRPLVMASLRFLVAGIVLCLWVLARGERFPNRREWAGAALLSIPLFVLDYGLVFWAEKRVPSGLTAIMLATIPAFMALSEIVLLRTQRLTVRLALA